MKNSAAIEINTVELTHALYNFQYAKGNTVFKINDSVVKIPDGSYLPARIANELTNVNIERINLLDTIEGVDNDALGGADGSGNALAAGDELAHETSQLKPLRLIPRRYLDSYKAPLICDLIMRNSDHFDPIAIDRFLWSGCCPMVASSFVMRW